MLIAKVVLSVHNNMEFFIRGPHVTACTVWSRIMLLILYTILSTKCQISDFDLDIHCKLPCQNIFINISETFSWFIFFFSFMNMFRLFGGFFITHREEKPHPNCTLPFPFFVSSPLMSLPPMRHFRLPPCPLLSPALPVVHSSGWEWTSQLAPLKETHISGCSPFASVIFPSVETWPLSVHWLDISLSLSPSVFLPGSAVTATMRLCRSVKV